ncbi:MAG: pilus assembly protein N-terminal domain-containing protein, partial [Prevotella sp.]|nr:pilus assembly protein N-terminal domain-containing protein [Prevotella sp.]
PHFIDLGLPSGTKWACCNMGAQKPEEYGGYYAWGETEAKASYSWGDYTLCEGTEGTSRYIGDDIAGTEYDVAHVKWGVQWRMPSVDQIKELLDNCTNQSTTMNDVAGRIFTGLSGGSIFLPAAGYCWGEDCFSDGINGFYWSSTQDPSSSDISFNLSLRCSDNLDDAWQSADWRYSGVSVRPVSLPDLVLSNSIVSVGKGLLKTVEIVSGTGSYTIASSDPGVATAVIDDNSVIVTAMGVGEATITVTDLKSEQTASIEVIVDEYYGCPDGNHPHLIDLGLPSGTLWACCNVDTETPENQSPVNYGGYYAWGETETKDAYNWWNTNNPDLGDNIAFTEYDVAHVKWGGTWMMPSQYQIRELMDNCTSEVMSLNGVNGIRLEGSNGATLFLPASGYKYLANDNYVGESVVIWSSSLDLNNRSMAYYGKYDKYGVGQYGTYDSYSGLCVRPVSCIVLSQMTYTFYMGDTYEVATIFSDIGTCQVSNSNPSVATVSTTDNSVWVKCLTLGQTTITVTDAQSGQRANIQVAVVPKGCPDDNHPHLIDLDLPSGIMWACCNVGATIPEGAGDYYQWGITTPNNGYSWWSTYSHSDHDGTMFYTPGSDIAGTGYDVAHELWKGSWVMPSYDQCEELLNNCSAKSTTLNDVTGVQFIGKNGNYIFLPTAGGYFDSDMLEDFDEAGYYWTSTLYPNNEKFAYSLYLTPQNNYNGRSYRCYSKCVRAVSKPASRSPR